MAQRLNGVRLHCEACFHDLVGEAVRYWQPFTRLRREGEGLMLLKLARDKARKPIAVGAALARFGEESLEAIAEFQPTFGDRSRTRSL